MKYKMITLLVWFLVIVFNIGMGAKTAQAASPESDFAFDPATGTITAYLGTGGKVEIPSKIGGKSVAAIGYYAFKDCTSLTKVTIPEGVTSIGDWTFENCTSLSRIIIPEGMTSLGIGAFKNCTTLNYVTIPEGVKSIGKWAFENCISLNRITIPESMASIEAGVFKNCTSLVNITIPKTVTNIERWAFENCTSLTDITIPEAVTSIEAGIFKNCISLVNVTIPKTVTSIGGWAFENCTSLTSITIPEAVKSIGEGAFYKCSALTNVAIPEAVTGIGNSAFNSSFSLASAYFEGNTPSNFGDFVFDLTAPDFTIYAKYGSGFTEPIWNGYNCILLRAVTIDEIIDTVKQAIADGTLIGNGEQSAEKADSFLKKLEDVKPKIEQDKIQAAINNLDMIYAFVDGKPSPEDLVVGDASRKISWMIFELIHELE